MKKVLIIIPLLVVILLFTRAFVWELFHVPSSSMKPNLLPGDYILVDKTISFDDLNYGDVVVFYHDSGDGKRVYVKRLIAKPGDTFEIQKGQFLLNGVAWKNIPVEPKIKSKDNPCEVVLQKDPAERQQLGLPALSYSRGYRRQDYVIAIPPKGKAFWQAIDDRKPLVNSEKWEVPKNSFFVLGDNLSHSRDSRFYGFVKIEDFIGRAESIGFSLSKEKYSCGTQILDWADIYLRRSREGLTL